MRFIALLLFIVFICTTTCTLYAQKADIRPYTVLIDSCKYQYPGILRVYFTYQQIDTQFRHHPAGMKIHFSRKDALFTFQEGLSYPKSTNKGDTLLYNQFMYFGARPNVSSAVTIYLGKQLEVLLPEEYLVTLQLGHHDSIGYSLYAAPFTFKVACNDVILKGNAFPTMCGEANGRIMGRAARGIYPYQYKLNEGKWSEQTLYEALLKGKYTLYVKDAQGCTDSTVVNIENVKGDLPKVPQHLQASDGKCGQVDLVCDSVKDANKYHFFREGKLVGISPKPTLIDYKGAFSPASYTVMASNPCGDSPQSEAETGYQVTQPRTCDMPKKLIVSTDEHTLFAKWDSVPNAEGYVFYYKMGKDTDFKQVSLDSNVYTMHNIPNNTSYTVYVKAVCGCEKTSARTTPVMGVVGYAECGTFKATLQIDATSVTFSTTNTKENMPTLIQYRKKGSTEWTETKLKTCVNLVANTIYEYQGRNICPDNSLGKWSDIAEFTTTE